MSWKLFSMLAVTVAFLGLVVWVYLPRNKDRLDSYGSMPLEQDSVTRTNDGITDQGTTEERP